MKDYDLSFNVVAFGHPSKEFTFYFYKDDREDLRRVHHQLVPDEVKNGFGEQEHYYTSFEKRLEGALAVTKRSTLAYIKGVDEHGEIIEMKDIKAAFSLSAEALLCSPYAWIFCEYRGNDQAQFRGRP